MNIHEERLKDLQHLLKKEKLDALVVSRPLEQGFLTGYRMDGYLLLVSRTAAWAFMPKMFIDQFREKVNFVSPSAPDDQPEAAISKIRENKFRKTAFEPETESYLSGRFWRKTFALE